MTAADVRHEHEDNLLKRAWHYRAYLFIPITIVVLAWFLFIAEATYSFSSTIESFGLRRFFWIFTGIPHNIDLLFLLLAFLFSATGPGYFLLRACRCTWDHYSEEALFSGAIGLILYTFLFMVLGAFGILTLTLCYLVFGIGLLSSAAYIALRYRQWRENIRAARRSHKAPVDDTVGPQTTTQTPSWHRALQAWLAVLLVLYLYVALLGALTPETSFDARWYHLGPVRTYVREDRFTDYVAETNMRAAVFDTYQVVLYTVLWKFDGMIAAKLVHWGDALLTVLAILCFARLFFGSITIGLLGALIYISTPLVSWSAGTAGNDLQLCFYTLLSVHAILRWHENPQRWQWLALAGLTCGYALGSKWIGVYSVLLAFALVGVLTIAAYWRKLPLVAIPRRIITALFILGVATTLSCIPWLARSYDLVGNPIYPYLNNLFNAPYPPMAAYDPSQTQDLRPQAIFALFATSLSPETQYRAVLGPIFIFFLPLCLIHLLAYRGNGRHTLRIIGFYLLLWAVLWRFTSISELRYTIALLPLMSMFIAHTLLSTQWSLRWQAQFMRIGLGAVTALIILLNLYPFIPLQRASSIPGAFAQPKIAFDYLYKGAAEESVQLVFVPMIVFMNKNLSPEHDKVFDYSQLILYAAYSDITLYSGSRSIDGSYPWTPFSADALPNLKQIGATYVSMLSEDALKLGQYPIAGCMEEVNRTADGQVLLKINYTQTVDMGTSQCTTAKVGHVVR